MSNNPEDYRCVINNPQKLKKLKSTTWFMTFKGTHVKLPTRYLFILEDGTVCVRVKTISKGNWEFKTLASLLEEMKKTTIVENFSKP